MSIFFELQVRDNTEEYSFHVEKKIEENTITYYAGNMSGASACMIITYNTKVKHAQIQGLSYYPECSINKKLKASVGTKLMFKGVLKLVLLDLPNIRKFELVDQATKFLNKYSKKIQITPRRLLLEHPGWYQEHFGALPTKMTLENIKKITKKVVLDEVDSHWGSFEDIMKLLQENGVPPENIHELFCTHWYIPAGVVRDYGVSIQSKQITVGGGKKYTRFSQGVGERVIKLADLKERIEFRHKVMSIYAVPYDRRYEGAVVV